nr:carboxypeptidase-like regulatory domain-containing protein [Gemmatimonadaceae bacterium]
MHAVRTRIGALALGVAALVASSARSEAQGGIGTISGRVTDRTTRAALADVQVQVVGTVRGARTTADGAYRITNVPAGSYTVRALRLGYSQGVAQLVVTAGGTVTADFTIGATATNLDEITVSATGEQQR